MHTIKETTHETIIGGKRYRVRIAAKHGRCTYYIKTEIYKRGLLMWGSPDEERIDVALDREALLSQYDDAVANTEAIARQHHADGQSTATTT